MARKLQVGFEMQVMSSIDAWQTGPGVGGGAAFSSSTSPARIDGRSARIQCATAGTFLARQNLYAVNQTTTGYARAYIYIATSPGANTSIMHMQNVSNTAVCQIQLNTDNSLAVLKADGTQLGSDSSALPSNTWVRVELKNDASSSPGTLEARYAVCDGSGVDPGNGAETTFASGNNSSQGSWGKFAIAWTVSTTGDIYFDDVAFNDSGGSYQNSWPGSGHIVIGRPNAAGDSNMFLDNAGAAGTTNNYTLVDEVPVNTSDYVKSTTLNDIDMYNVGDFGLSSSDTINVVEHVYRYGNNTADATAQITPQLIKTSGGTVTTGPANIPNATGFTSSNTLGTANKDFKTYLDPDGAAWTNSTIDSMQVGYKMTAVTANEIRVTTVWVYVDYTPAVAAATGPRKLAMMGVG